MSDGEEALRRSMLELRLLEGTGGELQARLNMLNAFSNELRVASATFEGLKGETGGITVLLPVGMGSYVRAVIEDPKKILVGVGAGVSIEKDADQAMGDLKEQQDQLESARRTVQQQLTQIIQRISELRGQVNDLSRRVTEGTKVV
jgi:prefoldin alpha subunit